MTTPDWHAAQVIDATTLGGERKILLKITSWHLYRDSTGGVHDRRDLSDVRVIVDRDGDVAPPPINRDAATRAVFAELNLGYDHRRYAHRFADAVVTAALGGDQ